MFISISRAVSFDIGDYSFCDLSLQMMAVSVHDKLISTECSPELTVLFYVLCCRCHYSVSFNVDERSRV